MIMSVALSEMRKFVEDDRQAEKALRKFSANLAHAQYQRLGWKAVEGESESDTKLRATILGLMLYGEDSDAQAVAKKIYIDSPITDLDPELRPLILSSVVRNGDETIVDQLLARYKASQSGELRQDICVGITSTRIPAKINQLLDTILDSTIVRPQDVGHWFVYLIRGLDSRTLAWDWMKGHWSWIEKTFSGDKSYDDYPRYSAGGLSTQLQLEQYIEFFTSKQDIPALSRVITMGISEIQGRVELIERDGPAVCDRLINLD
jgi:aminopeptidase N